mmetsp:Transcript_7161/g.14319  ORF Transcript_7161/g.14319 Transcript_7161/m.14319 type:complete len:205 (+) Transcript_7161:1692-2306(+)
MPSFPIILSKNFVGRSHPSTYLSLRSWSESQIHKTVQWPSPVSALICASVIDEQLVSYHAEFYLSHLSLASSEPCPSVSHSTGPQSKATPADLLSTCAERPQQPVVFDDTNVFYLLPPAAPSLAFHVPFGQPAGNAWQQTWKPLPVAPVSTALPGSETVQCFAPFVSSAFFEQHELSLPAEMEQMLSLSQFPKTVLVSALLPPT